MAREYGALTIGQNDEGRLELIGEAPTRCVIALSLLPSIISMVGSSPHSGVNAQGYLVLELVDGMLVYRPVEFDATALAVVCELVVEDKTVEGGR